MTIEIKFTDGSSETFDDNGGREFPLVEYVQGFVKVRNKFGTWRSFPADTIKEVVETPRSGW